MQIPVRVCVYVCRKTGLSLKNSNQPTPAVLYRTVEAKRCALVCAVMTEHCSSGWESKTQQVSGED